MLGAPIPGKGPSFLHSDLLALYTWCTEWNRCWESNWERCSDERKKSSKATVTLACHIYIVTIETPCSPTVSGKKSTARRFSFRFLSPYEARNLTINSFPVTGVPAAPFCSLIRKVVLYSRGYKFGHLDNNIYFSALKILSCSNETMPLVFLASIKSHAVIT